jgi:hypothetical protein
MVARGTTRAAVLLGALALVPTASAHDGGDVSIGGIVVHQWHALVPLLVGIAAVVASAYLPRLLRPEYAHYGLYGVAAGLVVAVIGAIALVQLSPYEWFTTRPPIPRAIHDPLMLLAGLLIALGSAVVGQLRWPRRPRYAGVGILLGLWVAYPGFAVLGVYTETNPLGYLIVLALPLALGYVLWRDARGVLGRLRADRVARRFGIGVGLLGVVFFLFSTGMVTVVPDDGVGLSWSQGFLRSFPVLGPLVLWPALEVWAPSVPFSGMLSVGTVILVGTLGVLVGLNAALVASRWLGAAGSETSGSTAGVVGIAAPQACCCCGPLLSQVGVVVLGPSLGAPIYLLFADPSSSIGSLFFVASVAILTGILVRAGSSDPKATRWPARSEVQA